MLEHGANRTVSIRFDRGTLVVDGASRPDVERIRGLFWDARTGVFRAPPWLRQELADDLRSHGLEVLVDHEYRRAQPAGWNEIPLRSYQEAAVDAWLLSNRRGVIVLPTGSGKTRLALSAMARTNARTLCIVPTRVLLDQWIRQISTAYGGPVGQLGDGARRVEAITVSTCESAYRQMERLGDQFDLLVIDEVHHFGNGSRDEALEMCTAPLRLGLTATPIGSGPARERLDEIVGPMVFCLGVGDLAGRFLADFDVITLCLELTDAERRHYQLARAAFREVHEQFSRAVPGASWVDFVRASQRTAAGRRALSAWRYMRKMLSYTHGKRRALASLLARHRDARLLVFTEDNATAYAVAREYLIHPLTCDIKKKERTDVLARFAAGELTSLVSAQVLNEGLDVPDADVAIILGGAQGRREHVQRVGRLLRPRSGKRALVYELVSRDTVEELATERKREALGVREAFSS